MKRMAALFSAIVIACSLALGQSSTTGQLGTDKRKAIYRTNATPPVYHSDGLGLPGTTLAIGTVMNYYRQRAYFQWALSDEVIPDGCTIDSVRLQFTAPPNGHSYPLYYFLASIPFDLTSSATDSAIFESTTASVNEIDNGQYNNDYTVDRKWYGPTSAIAQAISQQIHSNRFTLGIYANGEGVYSYSWSVRDWTVKLTIWYTPQSTTLHQKLEDHQTEYGKVNLWESGAWHEYIVPTNPLYFPIYSTQAVRADTLFATGTTQKHHDWDNPSDVKNHGDHFITVGRHDITSNFLSAHNATIQAQLIDGGSIGGSVDFKNPWLRDSVDSKGWLSRGTNAIWRSVSSGTNNVGTETIHQGVFLNQGEPNFTRPPYYSVGAPQPNIFTINNQNYTAYFQNWDNSQPTQIVFQNANAAQTGVVFKQSGATAVAKYKGHLISSSAEATSLPNQRKLTQVGAVLHKVYEGSGEIWHSISADGGGTWNPEFRVSDGSGGHSAPSIAWGSAQGRPEVYVVYRKQVGSTYQIKARLQLSDNWQTQVDVSAVEDPIPLVTHPRPVISRYDEGGIRKVLVLWEGANALMRREASSVQNNPWQWGPIAIHLPSTEGGFPIYVRSSVTHMGYPLQNALSHADKYVGSYLPVSG